MAWHIVQGLLEQIRIHSTFSGKLWIVLMFIFRIVVVARIGEHVYHDEQDKFICNTLTPGCRNICYNLFRPISEMRFWSLMVLVVSSPAILFCIYATHKIYHAYVKFPSDEEGHEPGIDPAHDYPKRRKRKRKDAESYVKATAPELFVVKQIDGKSEDQFDGPIRRGGKSKRPPRYSNLNQDEDKEVDYSSSTEDLRPRRLRYWAGGQSQNGYPIYADSHGRRVAFIKDKKPVNEAQKKREAKEMLKNPQLYRAYWWHVFIRTIFEVGFLVGQYYLYGFQVPEYYDCTRYPCLKTVECYVSRPMEKTIMIYMMFVLGAISCALSIGEFWSLGWERFKYALCCRGQKQTYHEKRMRLAELAKNEHGLGHGHGHGGHHADVNEKMVTNPHPGRFARPLSLSSRSSETTVESV